MEADILTQLLGIFFDGLEYVGPTLVAILTVLLFGGLKAYLRWVDTLPPWVQQLLVVATAGILTHIGAALALVLPTDLALFGEPELSTLLSAAMAYGIHAGKRAREK